MTSLFFLVLIGYIQKTIQLDCIGNTVLQLTKTKEDMQKRSDISNRLASIHSNPITQLMHGDGYTDHHFQRIATVGSKTFLISRGQAYSAYTANPLCNIYGGFLAEMENDGQYTGVINVLKSMSYPFYCLWVGVKDTPVEDTYVFYSSEKPAFTKFANGYPNGNTTTNCVAIYPNETPGWTMANIACRPNFFCHYICQLP